MTEKNGTTAIEFDKDRYQGCQPAHDKEDDQGWKEDIKATFKEKILFPAGNEASYNAVLVNNMPATLLWRLYFSMSGGNIQGLDLKLKSNRLNPFKGCFRNENVFSK